MKLTTTIFFTFLNIVIVSGQAIFQNTYSNFYKVEASGLVEIPNGELVVIGNVYDSISQKSDILLLNLNANGTINWEKKYGTAETDFSRGITLTTDNHLLLLCETFGLGNNSRDLLLIKTDLNGDTTWVKHLPLSGEEIVQHITEDSNGDYLIAAYTNSYATNNYDMLVIKMNSSGTILWSKTYGNASEETLNHISEQPTGGYLLVGTTKDGQNSKYGSVLSIDTNGNINWQKQIGGINDDFLFWGEMRADSSIYIGGYTTSYGFGALDAYLSKIDFNGNLIWSQTYGTSHIDFATTYTSTPDNGVLFAGGEDFLTIKTNSNGDVLWSTQYKISLPASPYRDLPAKVLVTSDNNYLILGKYRDFALDFTELYIAKVPPTGVPPCKGQDGRVKEMLITPTFLSTNFVENTQITMLNNPTIQTSITSDLILKEICTVSDNHIEVEKNSLKIIPNPAQDLIEIELPNTFYTEDYTISFWNTQGKLVKYLVGNQQDNTVSISELSRGIYFIKVKNSKKVYIGKLLVE